MASVTAILFTFIVMIGSLAANNLISQHRAWKILNSFDCGESAADRIIGGTNAALGQFPWVARLGYVCKKHTIMVDFCRYSTSGGSGATDITVYWNPEDDSIDWLCGGALITDRHVITASHCLPDPEQDYALQFVRLGEHDTRTNPDCELSVCAPPVQDRGIRTVTKHPLFNNPPFHNDIAVLELDKPAELNDFVAPICLPQEPDQLQGVQIGELALAAGWGKMNMTTEKRADILQVVALPIVKPEMCDLFGKNFKADASEICAGAQFNKDACGGDSGGPLMKIIGLMTVPNYTNGRKWNYLDKGIKISGLLFMLFEFVFDTTDGPKNFLVGIVSFGPTICGIRKPGVYSSVTYFLQWILDNVA